MQSARNILLSAIGLCAAAACAPTGPTAVNSAVDEAALRAADQAFEHAFYSGDIDTIVALYAEDAVLQPANAPAARGREAIRKYFVASIAKVKPGESETIGDSAVGVSGDLGWSSGTVKDTGPGGVDEGSGKFLSVSRKVNGKWLYIRDTWNRDAAQSP